MDAYLIIDTETLKRRKNILDKAIKTTRYRTRGKLIILLITGDKPTSEWAESIRTAIAYNFDVPIYIYALKDTNQVIEYLTKLCKDNDVIYTYGDIDHSLYGIDIDNNKIKCRERIDVK